MIRKLTVENCIRVVCHCQSVSMQLATSSVRGGTTYSPGYKRTAASGNWSIEQSTIYICDNTSDLDPVSGNLARSRSILALFSCRGFCLLAVGTKHTEQMYLRFHTSEWLSSKTVFKSRWCFFRATTYHAQV